MKLIVLIKTLNNGIVTYYKEQETVFRKADEWRGYSGGYLRINAHLLGI
jgi:hypothetical protein